MIYEKLKVIDMQELRISITFSFSASRSAVLGIVRQLRAIYVFILYGKIYDHR
jgi:hypothetical protein